MMSPDQTMTTQVSPPRRIRISHVVDAPVVSARPIAKSVATADVQAPASRPRASARPRRPLDPVIQKSWNEVALAVEDHLDLVGVVQIENVQDVLDDVPPRHVRLHYEDDAVDLVCQRLDARPADSVGIK